MVLGGFFLMLRSTIAQLTQPIYSAAWASDSEKLVICSGKEIHFKSRVVCIVGYCARNFFHSQNDLHPGG